MNDTEVLWRAVTESGAIYEYDGFGIQVDSKRRGRFYIRAMVMKNVDRNILQPPGKGWDYLLSLPNVEIPEVGKAIFTSNINEWNISTHVVSLEVFDREES